MLQIEKICAFLRIKPLNKYNSPARGVTVILKSSLRTHAPPLMQVPDIYVKWNQSLNLVLERVKQILK